MDTTDAKEHGRAANLLPTRSPAATTATATAAQAAGNMAAHQLPVRKNMGRPFDALDVRGSAVVPHQPENLFRARKCQKTAFHDLDSNFMMSTSDATQGHPRASMNSDKANSGSAAASNGHMRSRISQPMVAQTAKPLGDMINFRNPFLDWTASATAKPGVPHNSPHRIWCRQTVANHKRSGFRVPGRPACLSGSRCQEARSTYCQA
jgi:hypothetical protein